MTGPGLSSFPDMDGLPGETKTSSESFKRDVYGRDPTFQDT